MDEGIREGSERESSEPGQPRRWRTKTARKRRKCVNLAAAAAAPEEKSGGGRQPVHEAAEVRNRAGLVAALRDEAAGDQAQMRDQTDHFGRGSLARTRG